MSNKTPNANNKIAVRTIAYDIYFPKLFIEIIRGVFCCFTLFML